MDVCENIFDNENLTECELKCETEKECKEKKNTEDDKWLEHKNVSFSCIVRHINTGIHTTYLPFEATHFREIFAPPPNG